MKEYLKNVATTKIPGSRIQLCYLAALLSLLWIVLISSNRAAMTLMASCVLVYFISVTIIKRVMRTTTIEAVLIERYFIWLGVLLETTYIVALGCKEGFTTLTWICFEVGVLVVVGLTAGIAIHLKSRKNFYHGVKKMDLLK